MDQIADEIAAGVDPLMRGRDRRLEVDDNPGCDSTLCLTPSMKRKLA